MNNELVPFGKYKGQPVEALAADKGYCEWLVAQEWFRSRFAGLHTLIINNFAAPSETPEHNALQAKFLDKVWCLRFMLASEGLEQIQSHLKAAVEVVTANRQNILPTLRERLAREEARDITADAEAQYARELDDCERNVKFYSRDYHLQASAIARLREKQKGGSGPNRERIERVHRDRIKDMSAGLAQIENTLRELANCSIERLTFKTSRLEFEVGGIDVLWTGTIAFTGCRRSAFPIVELSRDEYGSSLHDDGHESCAYSMRYRIECKPALGDDYPAVLRQMRASECRSLVIGAYTGVGATLEQVRRVFGDIQVLTVDDIDQQLVGMFLLAKEEEP